MDSDNCKAECIGVVPGRQALPQQEGAIMAIITCDFTASREARERRLVRWIIRSVSPDILTRSERDILMVIANLWFQHRNGPTGMIYPGREGLAKRAKVCDATVKTSLRKLRKLGIIEAVMHQKGGSKATRYVVHVDVLSSVLCPSGVVSRPGDLTLFEPDETVSFYPPYQGENYPVEGAKNYPRILSDVGHRDTEQEPLPESDFWEGTEDV